MGSKLFIHEIIVLFALWCADIPIHSAVYFTHVSERSISIHYSMFQSRWIQNLKNDIFSNRLGGFSVCVQIDECLFGHAKYHIGKNLKLKQIWFFGMVSSIGRVTRSKFPLQESLYL